MTDWKKLAEMDAKERRVMREQIVHDEPGGDVEYEAEDRFSDALRDADRRAAKIEELNWSLTIAGAPRNLRRQRTLDRIAELEAKP